MEQSIRSVIFFGIAIIVTLNPSVSYSQSGSPKPIFLDLTQLEKYHSAFAKRSHDVKPLFDDFFRNADSLLTMKPLSVTDKEQTPPSGDKHDFLSMGPYWWPDSTKSDGLPYIRKDGQRNPEYYTISDQLFFGNIVQAVEKLSIAYAIAKDPRYSAKASELLRVWFLDEKTRMNPNMNHAQYIPGINTGRGIGIIETRYTFKILDALCLLESSSEWKKSDREKMTNWISAYFQWLTTHQYGIDESNEKNNHVQTVSLALYLGKKDYAMRILEEAKTKRIAVQIEADGKQPLELARTRSWSYSTMNLSAFFHLATLAERAGVDLWGYKNPDGGSIRKALDYLLPFAINMSEWKFQQISKTDDDALLKLLIIAQNKFDKKIYSEWMNKIYPNPSKLTIEKEISVY
jgi:hypothetical protein